MNKSVTDWSRWFHDSIMNSWSSLLYHIFFLYILFYNTFHILVPWVAIGLFGLGQSRWDKVWCFYCRQVIHLAISVSQCRVIRVNRPICVWKLCQCMGQHCFCTGLSTVAVLFVSSWLLRDDYFTHFENVGYTLHEACWVAVVILYETVKSPVIFRASRLVHFTDGLILTVILIAATCTITLLILSHFCLFFTKMLRVKFMTTYR